MKSSMPAGGTGAREFYRLDFKEPPCPKKALVIMSDIARYAFGSRAGYAGAGSRGFARGRNPRLSVNTP
jgi:hypothetical protein